MTIKEQANYVVTHPMMESAVAAWRDGDCSCMVDLLVRIQLHCIDTQVKASAKEYGSCKRMNSSDIKDALLGMKLPDGLAVYLPIPPRRCVVVEIKKDGEQNEPRLIVVP